MCMLGLQFIFFFFFKQKTAYEMRISDWSSDVCSSDLDPRPEAEVVGDRARERDVETIGVAVLVDELVGRVVRVAADSQGAGCVVAGSRGPGQCQHQQSDRAQSAQAPRSSHACVLAVAKHPPRSAERREGKACVSTCRSRLSPLHKKTKTNQ